MQINRESLRKSIKLSGRTREWLADRSCVEVDTINQYLCGSRQPSKAVVRLMAIALEVPESELTLNETEKSKAS